MKQLTLKTTMLLALLSGQRVQTLQALTIDHMSIVNDKLEFGIPTLLKQSKPGKHLSTVSFSRYPEDTVCIVKHVQMYLEETRQIRTSDKLLLSFHKPHHPVTTNTISRWIKTVLSDSGIDVSLFKAHSTRAASTSAAQANGLPIDSILEKVGWSKDSTFAKFYSRDFGSCLNEFVHTKLNS